MQAQNMQNEVTVQWGYIVSTKSASSVNFSVRNAVSSISVELQVPFGDSLIKKLTRYG